MLLKDILKGVDYAGKPNMNIDAVQVLSDSRKVGSDSIFVAIKGFKSDGHAFVANAVAQGALLIVCEQDMGLGEKQIIVENSRSAYAVMCANLNGNPSRRLRLIGVTGTNGKTTITNVIKQVLEHLGHKVGLIGTIENEIDELTLPAKHTTPDPAELHVLFARMVKAGCEFAVMETSSHAMDQHRLDGCRFEAGVFTNLTQDHLDYHGTMEEYYKAKKKLFQMADSAVVNYDDAYGQRLIEELRQEGGIQIKSFSIMDDRADYTARNIDKHEAGVDFAFVGAGVIERMKFCMPGSYSVSNAMAVTACLYQLGIPINEISKGLAHSKGVRGRTEIIPTGLDFTIICDYAHSPDGLQKVLTAVKDFAKGRVVCLFGCAGDRDPAKRPLMGRIVSELADFVVLTSDNPRSEDPQRIIDQTLKGVKEFNTPHKVFVDRYQAIKWALDNAERDDIVILAGKGHEDYQVLSFGTIAFDEHAIVQELLDRLKLERGK